MLTEVLQTARFLDIQKLTEGLKESLRKLMEGVLAARKVDGKSPVRTEC